LEIFDKLIKQIHLYSPFHRTKVYVSFQRSRNKDKLYF